jgi:hypothetical protein
MSTLNIHSVEDDSAVGCSHYGDANSVADFYEQHVSSIFRDEVRRLHECSYILCRFWSNRSISGGGSCLLQ